MKGRPKQITRETTAMAKATGTTTTTEAVTTIRKQENKSGFQSQGK